MRLYIPTHIVLAIAKVFRNRHHVRGSWYIRETVESIVNRNEEAVRAACVADRNSLTVVMVKSEGSPWSLLVYFLDTFMRRQILLRMDGHRIHIHISL